MGKPKVAILYIALERYICFWKEFYESCEEKLLNCEKHYYVWTSNESFEYSDAKNVTVLKAKRLGWPLDTVLRFEKFLQQEKELSKYDYIYVFNANMKFINDVDLSEIAPQAWHKSGIVAGLHPFFYRKCNPDEISYERRPESTAYIPYGKGEYYLCGAFNGGRSKDFLKMCKVLDKNIKTDLKNGIEACVDDESHLNAYLVDKSFLVVGRAYGFPEGHLKHLRPKERDLVKIISRHKENPKYGGIRWLRGQTDRKITNTKFTPFLIAMCKIIALFVPVKKLRHRIRKYFGSYS